MASRIEEIQRLRAELATVKAERDEAQAAYTELAGHTQKYIAVKDEADDRTQQQRDLALYQRGWLDAERRADELHRDGMAHDRYGRMTVMEVPQSLPEPKSLDQQIAEVDDWERREGEWRYEQHQREQAQRQEAQRQRDDQAELHHYRAQREARPKTHDREKAG
jgi:hypothetical protein